MHHLDCDVLLIALARIEQDARTLNLARALAEAGMQVVVIAAASNAARDASFRVIPWDDPGGSALQRWRSLSRFVRTQRIRPRVVGAMDFFALVQARAMARRCDVPLFYDMREFTFALGPLQGRGWKQRVISAIERWALRDVDRVIVSGPLDAKVVHERYQLPELPTVVMNTPPYQPRVPSTILRDRFSIPADHAVVIYQGVVHHGRGIEPFLRALPLMPDVHLCVVGDGPARDELRTRAMTSLTSPAAARVHWMDSVPYDQLHPITCSAAIGLCTIEPVSMSYEYALPNKLFEYMMAEIPSIVTDLPALRAQLAEIPAGILVGRGQEATELADAVRRLRQPATAAAMAEQARRVRSISYDQQARRVVDLVRDLLR